MSLCFFMLSAMALSVLLYMIFVELPEMKLREKLRRKEVRKQIREAELEYQKQIILLYIDSIILEDKYD